MTNIPLDDALRAHESARAVAIEAASRIVADTDSEEYRPYEGYNTQEARDHKRTQATVTMAHHFYRFIMYGDTEI